MIKITVRFVNGSMTEWDEDAEIVGRLEVLEASGYKGKSLINRLITDDWGVPPSGVIFEGMYQGKKYSRSIRYE